MAWHDINTSMLEFEQFDVLFQQAIEDIPTKFKEGVSQFILEIGEKPYSKYMMGLYVLGHYHPKGSLGLPTVTLYFGSFKRAYPHKKIEDLRLDIAKVLAHELLHHWELKSGYDALGEEDRRELEAWKKRVNYSNKDAVGRNLIEVLLFIYLCFVLIAVLSRWIMLSVG